MKISFTTQWAPETTNIDPNDLNVDVSNTENLLNAIFYLQGNNPEGKKINEGVPSISVGDIVCLNDKTFYCASLMRHGKSWIEMTDDQVSEWHRTDSRDRERMKFS